MAKGKKSIFANLPEIKVVPIESIIQNEKNPRFIREKKFEKLVKSIQDFPEMLMLRPVIVDDNLMALGGNMRHRAAIAAGLDECPIIYASMLSEKQMREFIIKDNIGFGEWDDDIIANEFDESELIEWGYDVPVFDAGGDETPEKAPAESWFLNIRCDDEKHAEKLYKEFIADGLDVKIVN